MLYIAAILGLFAFSAQADDPVVLPLIRVPVFRYYSPDRHDHYYLSPDMINWDPAQFEMQVDRPNGVTIPNIQPGRMGYLGGDKTVQYRGHGVGFVLPDPLAAANADATGPGPKSLDLYRIYDAANQDTILQTRAANEAVPAGGAWLGRCFKTRDARPNADAPLMPLWTYYNPERKDHFYSVAEMYYEGLPGLNNEYEQKGVLCYVFSEFEREIHFEGDANSAVFFDFDALQTPVAVNVLFVGFVGLLLINVLGVFYMCRKETGKQKYQVVDMDSDAEVSV